MKQSTNNNTNTVKKTAILAAAFIAIVRDGATLDNTASQILLHLREADADTLDKFDGLVGEAYAENGWQRGGGRPKDGTKIKPVPEVVRTYVSQIRAAYKLELKVLKYDSIAALREAVRVTRREALAEQREAANEDTEIVSSPELAGVRVEGEEQLNGAVFHDLIVVHAALDEDERNRLEATLERTLKKFLAPIKSKLKTAPPAKQPAKSAQRAAMLH